MTGYLIVELYQTVIFFVIYNMLELYHHSLHSGRSVSVLYQSSLTDD